jgi:hypothetical protein
MGTLRRIARSLLARALGSKAAARKGRRALSALLEGYRATALLYVAARLRLADLLADGPRSSDELAREAGAHAPTLHRILRGLVALGVCSEERDGRFGLTELGTWLRADVPRSLHGEAILCGEERAGAWGGLLHSATTGEAAYDHVFGASVWERRRQRPELEEHLQAGLARSTARAAEAVVAAYDFSRFHTIADVGGGRGVLLAAVLRAHPSLSGILFDRPHVADAARAHLEAAGVAPRCKIVGGDLFGPLPEGADAHLLKSVVHDWDDESALAILRSCHRALSGQATLLLVERLLPTRADDDPGTIWRDLHMLAITGGRERSETEHCDLLAAAGFTLTRVVPTGSPFSILEALRDRGCGDR